MKKKTLLVFVLSLFIIKAGIAQTSTQKTALVNYFKENNTPGGTHFNELIDACYNYSVGKGLILDKETNTIRSELLKENVEKNMRDSTQSLRSMFNARSDQMETSFADSTQALRTDFNARSSQLENDLQTNVQNLNTYINAEVNQLEASLANTAQALRTDFDARSDQLESDWQSNVQDLNTSIDTKINQLETDLQTNVQNLHTSINTEVNQLENALTYTAQALRTDFDARSSQLENDLQTNVQNLNTSMDTKVNQLETALADSTQVLRSTLNDFYFQLTNEISSNSDSLGNLLEEQKIILFGKIDSLADVHSVETQKQKVRTDSLRDAHNVLDNTVTVMKEKLDTLNYTEKNFTLFLKDKLDNIQAGATRSDNNFADSLVTKLMNIETNANNYQLPLATYDKLGGMKLSSDFVMYNGTVYNALDPDKIERQYAADTITANWTDTIKLGDEWTRIRLRIPTGEIDGEGNKLYNYGDWNPPYKFAYGSLETSFYEFNGSDSSNVILGLYEREKEFKGTNNTLLGHSAGYSLYNGGNRNVMLGRNAGAGSQKSDNVFLGYEAGKSAGDPAVPPEGSGAYTGERNVAVGNQAMKSRNGYEMSVAVGYMAMESGEQSSSVAVGYGALGENNGSGNIAVGYEAAFSAGGSANTQNIAIGYRAGFSNITAARNIMLGDSAAFANTAGDNNVFIGHGGGSSNTGSRNLVIGNDISPAGSDKMAIGNNGQTLISGDFTTGEVTIDNLSTSDLDVGNVAAGSYLLDSDTVINNARKFTGYGGVNTTGRIISTYANTKGDETVAIQADNGTIKGKYLAASHAIHLGSGEVVNSSGQFIGSGGVNTTGNITTNSTVSGATITASGELYAQTNLQVYHTGNKPTPSDVGAAPSVHNHDAHNNGRYAALGHDHDLNYAQKVHGHTGVYAPSVHDHDTRYAAINHDADHKTYNDVFYADAIHDADHDTHNDGRYAAKNHDADHKTYNDALYADAIHDADHDTHNDGRYAVKNHDVDHKTHNDALYANVSHDTDHDTHNDSRYAAKNHDVNHKTYNDALYANVSHDTDHDTHNDSRYAAKSHDADHKTYNDALYANVSHKHASLYNGGLAKITTTSTGVSVTGAITASGDITAFSDARLKNVHYQLLKEKFLPHILKLKPTAYTWKDHRNGKAIEFGFIAQEVNEYFPQWVHQGSDGYYSVDYMKMGAVLAVQGIQEIYRKNEEDKKELQEQVDMLQQQIVELQKQIKQLINRQL